MFDVTLQAGPPSLQVPDEEQLKDGAKTLELVYPLLIMLPANGGLMPLPVANARVVMNREMCLDLSRHLAEEGEKLPEASNLSVASSMEDVERAAKINKRFKGIVGPNGESL